MLNEIDYPGKLIIVEGIDGSGKSTQISLMADAIRKANKYQAVLLTREPTWKASELRKKIVGDNDAFSDGYQIAKLLVEDRKQHTHDLIVPSLNQKVLVATDRYALSTCAYQPVQGVPLMELIEMHEKAQTITPDLTFFVHVSREEADRRKIKRGEKLEKYEKDILFIDKLISQYLIVADLSNTDERIRKVVGNVCIINGEQSFEKVHQSISDIVLPFYKNWLKTS